MINRKAGCQNETANHGVQGTASPPLTPDVVSKKMRLTQCILLALLICGCSTIPRGVRHAMIPRLDFSKTPPLVAIEQLSGAIAESNTSLPGIQVDRTPTRVIRPAELGYLAQEMDRLESRYLASIPKDFGEPFVTFSAEQISVHDACHIMSQLLSMNLVYRPDSIVFRFGPETAIFRTYSVPKGMAEALKNYPNAGWNGLRCFEPPPPWDDDCMLSLNDGTTVLVVGAEADHIEFKKELKKRRHNQVPEDTARKLADPQH